MNITYLKDIKNLFDKKSLIYGCFPSMEKIIKKLQKKKKIRLVYGETYDIYGLTIDSLKYYLYLSLLHQYLENAEFLVESYVIIGDIHSVKNKIVQDKKILLNKAKERLSLYQNLKQIYNLKPDAVLMSSLFKENKYIENYKYAKTIVTNSTRLIKAIEKIVLNNRLKQEIEAGFQYAIEEIALIMNYDLKVGPPREMHYDTIANYLKEKQGKTGLSGIYLKPTYPLGLGFDYFVCHPEIDKYGITPYKAGSNKLEDMRIIIGSTDLTEIKRLIDESYVPKNLDLPNPVLDLYIIADMARSLLDKESYINHGYEKLSNLPDRLKKTTYENLKQYILNPLVVLGKEREKSYEN